MQVSRITFDGLWRCLCPSFDVVAVPILIAPKNNSIGSNPWVRASIRPRPPWQVSARCLHDESGPLVRRLLAREAPVRTTKDTVKYSKPAQSSKPSPATIDELTILELHDSLRHLNAERGAYNKIASIVGYLIDKRGEKPSLLHYDALVRANADASCGSAGVVANLLAEMKNTGIVPDSEFYHNVLQALAIHPDFVLRNQVLADMKERWFSLTKEGWHDLAVGQLREQQYELALDTLETMQKQKILVEPWLYDIFVYLFCEAGDLDEALKMIRYQEEYGDMDISPYVWHYSLDAFSINYHYEGTLYTWRKRVETGYINPSDGMCINIMNTAARNRDPAFATDVSRLLADRASKLDIHHYEALVEAYASSSDIKGALHILTIMKKAGLEPSEATTRSIYSELRKWPNAPSDALKSIGSLQKNGMIVPRAVTDVVLEAYVFHGDVEGALGILKTVGKRNRKGISTAGLNNLLQACSNGKRKKAFVLSLASDMVNSGIQPNALTYDHLILACLTEDDYEDAISYLQELRAEFGVAKLREGTWEALLRKCGRARDDRAWSLLHEMESQKRNSNRSAQVLDDEWKASLGLN